MIDKQTTSEEVAEKLDHLTTASNQAQHGQHMALRQLGTRTYMLIYDWLEAHGVPFVYNKDEERYVEVSHD
jgi:hypothetical protein